MLQRFNDRAGHYLVLAIAHFLMTLPNLGAHSLWDMDEGVNAEAAREMLESGNWITPYYNYELRTAKPVFLYWLQATSYKLFGINEFAARLPAVICGLGTILLVYELARRMFSPSTGLLSGLVLASCIEFCLISHAATPDAPLLFFTTLTFTLYWLGSTNGRRWWYGPTGIAMGLAVLTKGPVGLALPSLVIIAHLAWERRWRELFHWRSLLGVAGFVLTCVPWYVLVSIDTNGEWIRAFFLKENVERFQSAKENHSGNVLFHLAFLIVLFAPWSIFLGITLWTSFQGTRSANTASDRSAYRFLNCWFWVYLIFFSLAATKLPNYILPLYPAIAILTGRFVDRWRLGTITLPRWIIPVSIAGLFLTGLITAFGLALAGGALPIPVKGLHPMAGMSNWIWIGLIPIVAAGLFLYFARTGQRDRVVTTLVIGVVAFIGFLAAFPTVVMNDYKAPRNIAEQNNLLQERDARIGAVQWLRHSLVFYVQRPVTRIESFDEAKDFLKSPTRSYILVPEPVWETLSQQITTSYTVESKHYDFLARTPIVVVSNRPNGSAK